MCVTRCGSPDVYYWVRYYIRSTGSCVNLRMLSAVLADNVAVMIPDLVDPVDFRIFWTESPQRLLVFSSQSSHGAPTAIRGGMGRGIDRPDSYVAIVCPSPLEYGYRTTPKNGNPGDS
jgi:hypothetical protein